MRTPGQIKKQRKIGIAISGIIIISLSLFIFLSMQEKRMSLNEIRNTAEELEITKQLTERYVELKEKTSLTLEETKELRKLRKKLDKEYYKYKGKSESGDKIAAGWDSIR